MGLFDWIGDLFKGEKEEQPAPRRLEPEQWQTDIQKALSEYGLGGGGPIRQSLLEEYGRDAGPLGLAGRELERTFGDYYDPYVGKQYAPFRETAMRQLEESKTRLGRGAQLRGMRESTPYLGLESKLEETTLSNLMAKLGELYSTERGRKQAAVPLSQQLATTLGGLEEDPLKMAMGLLQGYQPTYYQPSYRYQPSPFETGMGYTEQMSRILGNVIPGASPTGGRSLADYGAGFEMDSGGGIPFGSKSRLRDISNYYQY